MAKKLEVKTMSTPRVLEAFKTTNGLGADSPDEITITDTRGEDSENHAQVAQFPGPNTPAGANPPSSQASPLPVAKKQGAGRKKRLLIGARFREDEMGPTFKVVQGKLAQMLHLPENEVSMQVIMAAVVRSTIKDDPESLKWLANSILVEKQRSANELESALYSRDVA